MALPLPEASAADELADAVTAWGQNQCRCTFTDPVDLDSCIQEEIRVLTGCLQALAADAEEGARCVAQPTWNLAVCALDCQGTESPLPDECSFAPDCGERTGVLSFCLRRALWCEDPLSSTQAQAQALYFETCDGKPDCPNGFDEANCTPGATRFTCADGSSVTLERLLDGNADCPDGSDEWNTSG